MAVILDSVVVDIPVVSTSHDHHMALMMTMTTSKIVRMRTRFIITRMMRMKRKMERTTTTQYPSVEMVSTHRPQKANPKVEGNTKKPMIGWSILCDDMALSLWRQLSCFHGKW